MAKAKTVLYGVPCLFLVITFIPGSCSEKRLVMEFHSDRNTSVYKLFSDSSYATSANEKIVETGTLRSKGDTLFFTKDVEYNVTYIPVVVFLRERDSICRLERTEKENPEGVTDLKDLGVATNFYQYKRMECMPLRVIDKSVKRN